MWWMCIRRYGFLKISVFTLWIGWRVFSSRLFFHSVFFFFVRFGFSFWSIVSAYKLRSTDEFATQRDVTPCVDTWDTFTLITYRSWCLCVVVVDATAAADDFPFSDGDDDRHRIWATWVCHMLTCQLRFVEWEENVLRLMIVMSDSVLNQKMHGKEDTNIWFCTYLIRSLQYYPLKPVLFLLFIIATHLIKSCIDFYEHSFYTDGNEMIAAVGYVKHKLNKRTWVPSHQQSPHVLNVLKIKNKIATYTSRSPFTVTAYLPENPLIESRMDPKWLGAQTSNHLNSLELINKYTYSCYSCGKWQHEIAFDTCDRPSGGGVCIPIHSSVFFGDVDAQCELCPAILYFRLRWTSMWRLLKYRLQCPNVIRHTSSYGKMRTNPFYTYCADI